jgi:phosphopantothenoylcysteine decarboxylase
VRSLYLVVTAAPPVLRIEGFLTMLHADDWRTCVIATPTAASWIDLDALAETTDCLTRVHARPPLQQDSLPRADAVMAAPMTFNSINKWAAGISDNFALGVLNEVLCADVPIVAVPCVKPVLRAHPTYHESVALLVSAGVSMIDSDAVTRRAPDGLAIFDWAEIMPALG